MTKEQLYAIWTLLPELKADLNAVIASEIEKAKGEVQPAPNPIREAYHAYKPIRLKKWSKHFCIKKHSDTKAIDERGCVWDYGLDFDIHPEGWELYTEAEAEQVTEPAKPKFDKDRFEAMFRAVVESGEYSIKDCIFIAEEGLKQLDAYYATKKGGNNE